MCQSSHRYASIVKKFKTLAAFRGSSIHQHSATGATVERRRGEGETDGTRRRVYLAGYLVFSAKRDSEFHLSREVAALVTSFTVPANTLQATVPTTIRRYFSNRCFTSGHIKPAAPTDGTNLFARANALPEQPFCRGDLSRDIKPGRLAGAFFRKKRGKTGATNSRCFRLTMEIRIGQSYRSNDVVKFHALRRERFPSLSLYSLHRARDVCMYEKFTQNFCPPGVFRGLLKRHRTEKLDMCVFAFISKKIQNLNHERTIAD